MTSAPGTTVCTSASSAPTRSVRTDDRITKRYEGDSMRDVIGGTILGGHYHASRCLTDACLMAHRGGSMCPKRSQGVSRALRCSVVASIQSPKVIATPL